MRIHAVRSVFLGPLAGLVVACGDSTAPSQFDVTVTVATLEGPTFGWVGDTVPTIECAATLRAAIEGSGEATWGDAVLRFFAGANRSVPVDTAILPAATIQSAWGSATIKTGETPEFTIRITAELPYAGEMAFHYMRQSGGAGTATASFRCGSTINGGTSTPPTITTFTIDSVAGPLQPGDHLTLHYAATSDLGLWETVIELESPCKGRWVFGELLQHTTTRALSVQVPPTCALGPVTFTALTTDAAQQWSLRSTGPGITVVDVTRPTIRPSIFPPFGGLEPFYPADYFVGDSIYIEFNAYDNYNLRTLDWEVAPAGARDSIPVSGRVAWAALKIPVLSSWVGPIQLRLFARDSVGLTSDTVVTAPDSVTVHPTITRPVASATVNGEIRTIAIDQSRAAVYLMQTNQQRIAVLSTATMTVTQTITVAGPTDMDMTASGDSLLLALPSARALGVVDLRQNPLTVSLLPLIILDTTLDQRPYGVRVAANGKALIALEGTTASSYALMEVDLRTGVQRFRPEVGDSGNVTGLERSLDRTYLVVSGLPGEFWAYDAIADTFGPRVTVSPDGGFKTIDATGQYFALGVDLFDRSLRFLRRAQTPLIPGGASLPTALAGDGSILYQGYGYGVMRYRVSDGALLDRSPDPFPVSGGFLRVSPDGARLVLVDSDCCFTSGIAIMDIR